MKLVYRSVCSLALAFFLTTAAACGEGGDRGAGGGAIASVAWDPVNDPTVVSYTVHYGKQSSGSVGSCDYEHSVDVTVPATALRALSSIHRTNLVIVLLMDLNAVVLLDLAK